MAAPLRLHIALFALLVAVATGCGAEGDGPPAEEGPDAAPAQAVFMESCAPSHGDEACEGDLVCFSFNSRGPHCTHACTVDADCTEPSRGCSNMGVCKAP